MRHGEDGPPSPRDLPSCCACGGPVAPDGAIDAGGGDVACCQSCADAMTTNAPNGALVIGLLLAVVVLGLAWAEMVTMLGGAR